MLDIKIDNANKKKKPKIRFCGYTNDLLNELMEINIYLLNYILDKESLSLKEQMDLIDEYTKTLKNTLLARFKKEEIAANGTPK